MTETDMDLYIFANLEKSQGAIYHVTASDWIRHKVASPYDYASVRDMLRDGAVLFAFPLDNHYPPTQRCYAVRLPAIDITRSLKAPAHHTPAPKEDSTEMQPDDLFLLATTVNEDAPSLYRLKPSIYTKTQVTTPPANVLDMFAHGTALAAMPPSAGTLCYLINLASLALHNPAYKLQ